MKHLFFFCVVVGAVFGGCDGCGTPPDPDPGDDDDAGVPDDDCVAGGCGDDVCDDVTGLCRPATACEDAGCAQHQRCEQAAGADAVCLAECDDGFDFVAGGCTASPSCDAADPGYCGDHRVCVNDVCGACEEGFVDVAGDCVEDEDDCAGLDCDGVHRDCVDGACGGCADGFAEDEEGVCVGDVSCESLNCQAPLECVFEAAGGVPTCRAPSTCPAQQVQNSSGTCVACTACFNGGVAKDGVVDVGNGGIAFGSSCICALEDNFFQGVDGVVRSCDADGDGWVNSRLLTSINLDGNPNNPFAANHRCHVREIDRFELRGDDFRAEFAGAGSYAADAQRTVLISSLNLGAVSAKLYEPEETDDPAAFGLRYKQQGTPPEKLLRSYGLTAPVNTFDDDTDGHLRAAEVNPLTKACNHDNDDANLDGVADVAQIHGAFPAGTTGFGPDAAPAADVFYKFAYFLELEHGFFRDRVGSGVGDCDGAVPCFGAFVIEEKHRAIDLDTPAALRLELTYDAAADPQWQTCMRGRDSSYPGASSNEAQNADFAEFSAGCEATSGACLVGGGAARHIPYDGRAFDTDRIVDGVASEAGFVGMNHASQFKCVSFDAAQNNVPPARRKPVDDAVFNDCRLEPRASDAPLTPGEANPADPVLACTTTTPEPSGATSASRNFWVAIEHDEYAAPGGYTRGCISEGAEWGEQVCVVAANTTPDDRFGSLFCACGDFRGGVDCELSCPPSQVAANRTANLDSGGVEGFFSCFVPAGSAGATLSGGAFTLRGGVPAASTSFVEQRGGAFVLKPLGAP